MNFEIQLIMWLQSLKFRPLDYILYGFTQLGEKVFFVVVAMLFYWCIDRRKGFCIVNIFILGHIIVGAVKAIVARPRPYTIDGVKSIFAPTSGYSFPSGHSYTIACLSGTSAVLMRDTKAYKPILGCGIALTAIVMFSRIYLGQHYLTDTIAGAALGILMAISLEWFYSFLKNEENIVIVALPLTVLAFAVLAIFDLIHPSSTITALCGFYGMFTLGYWIEKHYVNYELHADKAYKYVLRMVIGLAVALALQSGLKKLVQGSSDTVIIVFDYIRYALIGLWTSLFAPVLFKKIRI